MAVFSISLISCFPFMLLRYCLSDFEMIQSPLLLLVSPVPAIIGTLYYYYRISPFSALAGKYSPILGCGNQHDYARWSYLLFRRFLTFEHVPRITDIFAFVYMYLGASQVFLDFVIVTLELLT